MYTTKRKKMKNRVNIIGAGLAGCEACYQLLTRGYDVHLYEMKTVQKNPVQKLDTFCELVCSNSLKSNEITNACGLLKEELRILGSLVIECADQCKVPSGSALSVDRNILSKLVTDKLKSFDNLTVHEEEVCEIDTTTPTIIATGPLTSDKLCQGLKKLFGEEYLYFFDAVAPIVDLESLDKDHYFVADRYNKGTGDYVNCPLNKNEYLDFYNALVSAQTVTLKDFENNKVFEGCMPVEVLAKRGVDALRFGPMKPKGIWNPITKESYYAIVQLRKESNTNTLYNLVGFQTNLTYPEQKRVFSMIPALKNAEFVRYGVMHKNNYINAPRLLNKFYQLKKYPNIFIAGQLSGVEGYVESISSGYMCGVNMANYLEGKALIDYGNFTMIGALPNYITTASADSFQPMSSNWGIVPPLDVVIKDKKEKNKKLAERAINTLKSLSKDK